MSITNVTNVGGRVDRIKCDINIGDVHAISSMP